MTAIFRLVLPLALLAILWPGSATAQGIAPLRLSAGRLMAADPGHNGQDTQRTRVRMVPRRSMMSAAVQCPMPVAVPDARQSARMPSAQVDPSRYFIRVAAPGCSNPLGPDTP